MKPVDLGEQTSIFDRVYLGCTQRECKPNETIIVSAEQLKNCLGGKSLTQKNGRGVIRYGRSREKVH